MEVLGLHRGEVVEVRSAAEILATLDERGCLDNLPFMPEMISRCGQLFTVDRRADKVCDTIETLRSRRINDAVLLEGERCDGSGHAGCQADCKFYWHEAWLRRAGSGPTTQADATAEARLEELTSASASYHDDDGAVRYRCQATEMVRASDDLSTFAPGPYLKEYRTHDVSLGTFVKVMARAAVVQPMHKLNLLPIIPVKGPSSKSPVTEPLDLQPGEWVRVKSRDEIATTLTDKGRNRGLWFDREMLPFCGGTYRCPQACDAHHRGALRQAPGAHPGLRDARGRRLLRRAQHLTMVLPSRDPVLLAGVLVGAGRRAGARLSDRQSPPTATAAWPARCSSSQVSPRNTRYCSARS